jgi:hypothetical protein
MFMVNGAAGKDEALKSICLTMLNDANVNYSIQIYTDCTETDNPTSGRAALSSPQLGSTTYAGFYTIPLKEEISLKAGSKFAVVVTLSHDDENRDVKYDVDTSGPYHGVIDYKSKASRSQSFKRNNESSDWIDLYGDEKCSCDRNKDDGHEDYAYTNCVARVKAITEPVECNHKWDAGKVTEAATYNTNGVRKFTCTVCGATRTESIAKLRYSAGQNPNQKASDGTALGNGASAAAADAAITKSSREEGPAGSRYAPLVLKSTAQTKTGITLTWTKNSKATKYVIYGNACGKSNKMKKLKTVTGKTCKITKINKTLKKGTYHKFMVVALNSKNNVVSTSKVIHVATKGGKVGNHKTVIIKAKVNKNGKAIKTYKALAATKIKKGKSITIKTSATLVNKKLKVKKHRAVCYESSNPKIATVNAKGKITAKKKGKCYIYAYAQNGVSKKIKITVN